MNISLEERRALLRQAMQGADPAHITDFAIALDQADEADRAALTKTLPPSRLFKAEGPTPRACFVLVALGQPKLVAQTLAPADLRLSKEYSRWYDAMIPAVLGAAVERDAAWCSAFVDWLAQAWGYGERLKWAVCSRLVHSGLADASLSYLMGFLSEVSGDGRAVSHDEHGARIAARLQADPVLLDTDFWDLFRVEGIGASYYLSNERFRPAWDAALTRLSDTEPGFRARFLDQSLGALVRDFSARNITWYVHAHRLLDPTPSEILEREGRYLAVLGATPSSSVGLAQDMLLRAAKAGGGLDADAVIEASGAALGRAEKKCVKAQIALLAALDANAPQRQAISDLVSGVIDTLTSDLKPLACKLVIGVEAGDAVLISSVAASDAAVAVPGLRRAALLGATHAARDLTVIEDASAQGQPPSSAMTMPHDTPIENEDACFALVAEQLEGTGDGADLPRILAYLADHPRAVASQTLRTRAAEIIKSLCNETDFWATDDPSPRLHLAALIVDDAAMTPKFRGYARFISLGQNEAAPAGVVIKDGTHTIFSYDPKTGEDKVTEIRKTRSACLYLPTDSPAALLVEAIHKVWLSRQTGENMSHGFSGVSTRQARQESRLSKPCVFPTPVLPQRHVWERVVVEIDDVEERLRYNVLGAEPRALWRDAASIAGIAGIVADSIAKTAVARNLPEDGKDIAHRALNIAPVAKEFTFRAGEARDQDAYEQIVQWTAWLLQRNLDTFAAHFHPALYAATKVVNVRGIGAVCMALGASRQALSGPTYSALALGLSAKEAQHRAQAAEAVAALADSGLLDPDAFAAEIAAHLAEGFVQAGRLAQALSDAASISAIAGYRTLQTLAALLSSPAFEGVNQAGKLVELTARLADDYGTPVPLPAALAAKRKGASVLALAIRALEAVTPRPTELAEAAAAQARAAFPVNTSDIPKMTGEQAKAATSRKIEINQLAKINKSS